MRLSPRLRTLAGVVASVIREHALILWLSAAYVVCGGAVQTYLGRPWPIALVTPAFAVLWIAGSALYLSGCAVFSPDTRSVRFSLRSISTALLVASLVEPIHLTFQSLKQSIGPTVGFRLDETWSALDIWLHRGPAWRWLIFLLSPQAIKAIDLIYASWFVGLLVFLLWCSWSRRHVLRQRAIVAWLLLWIVGGTLGAWAGASAGPCYYQPPPEHLNPYADLLRQLDAVGFTFARYSQDGMIHKPPGPFAGISAMPSMHVGLACLAAIVAWQRNRAIGAFAAAVAVLMQVGSVLLGWHYAIDGYVGAALAVLCWQVSKKLVPEAASERLNPRLGLLSWSRAL